MAARLSLTVLCGCAALMSCSPAAPPAFEVTTEAVHLFPDDPGRRGLGELQFAGGLAVSGGSDLFGGFSAMEISPDGSRLIALSDSAAWLRASLIYGPDGDLTGLEDIELVPMLDEAGNALSGERADAEGLAGLGAGRYAVSFEREHRIAVYQIGADGADAATARPSPFPAPPGAERLRNNAGAEALARLDDSLWVGIEYPIVDGQPNTLWRYDLNRLDTPPVAMSMALTPGFGLTGLTSDMDGGMLVVERFWAREIGNQVVISHLSADALQASAGPLAPEPLAQFEPDMTVDNFEAVAVARINGQRRVFVLSDDNFNNAQRTLLLSFVWPED